MKQVFNNWMIIIAWLSSAMTAALAISSGINLLGILIFMVIFLGMIIVFLLADIKKGILDLAEK